jgi:hypothetical protein
LEVMTSEGVGIAGADEDARPTGELHEPAGGLDAGLRDPGVLTGCEVVTEGDEAGVEDPEGTGVNEEMEKVPVRGKVLGDGGGPLVGEETGQIVVEIAIVEVTTIVE